MRDTRAPHGDRRRYRQHCRCLPCRAANANYERCRSTGVLYPDPAALVDAALAECHLTTLGGQGVGYRQAAKLAGLSHRLVVSIRTGATTQIRADTQARILGIPAVLAHGQTVMGWRTWCLLDSLTREGFRRGALAKKLGNRSPQLRIRRRRLRVRTALKVRVLYGRVNDLAAKDVHGRPSR